MGTGFILYDHKMAPQDQIRLFLDVPTVLKTFTWLYFISLIFLVLLNVQKQSAQKQEIYTESQLSLRPNK